MPTVRSALSGPREQDGAPRTFHDGPISGCIRNARHRLMARRKRAEGQLPDQRVDWHHPLLTVGFQLAVEPACTVSMIVCIPARAVPPQRRGMPVTKCRGCRTAWPDCVRIWAEVCVSRPRSRYFVRTAHAVVEDANIVRLVGSPLRHDQCSSSRLLPITRSDVTRRIATSRAACPDGADGPSATDCRSRLNHRFAFEFS